MHNKRMEICKEKILQNIFQPRKRVLQLIDF